MIQATKKIKKYKLVTDSGAVVYFGQLCKILDLRKIYNNGMLSYYDDFLLNYVQFSKLE